MSSFSWIYTQTVDGNFGTIMSQIIAMVVGFTKVLILISLVLFWSAWEWKHLGWELQPPLGRL